MMRFRIAMERELGRGGAKGLREFERAYRRWLSERIRAERVVPFLAADATGRILGSGSVWLREERPHRGNLSVILPRIHGVYIAPFARRRGVATQLVRTMLQWVRSQGYRIVALRTTRRAKAIYARFGFRPDTEMELEWR
jgi:GNAT superfamily N-acetyltransferase